MNEVLTDLMVNAICKALGQQMVAFRGAAATVHDLCASHESLRSSLSAVTREKDEARKLAHREHDSWVVIAESLEDWRAIGVAVHRRASNALAVLLDIVNDQHCAVRHDLRQEARALLTVCRTEHIVPSRREGQCMMEENHPIGPVCDEKAVHRATRVGEVERELAHVKDVLRRVLDATMPELKVFVDRPAEPMTARSYLAAELRRTADALLSGQPVNERNER